MNHTDIDRPIFIVGPGRSGTTIFYNLLAGHRDLGWFYESWLSRRIRNIWLLSFLAFQNILYKIPSVSTRYRNQAWFPKPSEAYPVWDLFHPVEDSAASPPFTEAHVPFAKVDLMRSAIQNHLYFSKTSRFVSKNTRNSRRMRYLYKIFPDALFIHVIRDGRAVTNSLLNVGFWPSLRLWWYGGCTPAELQSGREDPVLLAARHWRIGIQRVFDDKKFIPKQQYIEIRYEDLMKSPKKTIQKVLQFCNLPWTTHFENHIDSFQLKTKNYKWSTRFTSDQKKAIECETGSLLIRLGYS